MDDEPGGVISMVNMLGLYDFNNMNFIKTVLMHAAVFVDVGANIGSYTLLASEIPGVVVVSLEPVPSTFAKLQRNIALNGRKNVHALNMAASRQAGSLGMACGLDSAVNHIATAHSPDPHTIMVEVDTLDAICDRLQLSPALMKIDVEGHESDVLAGAVQCLASCEACVIENGDRSPIMSFMQEQAMIGPLYYHHAKSSLMLSPQGLAEDPIYISRRFSEKFPGIAIAA